MTTRLDLQTSGFVGNIFNFEFLSSGSQDPFFWQDQICHPCCKDRKAPYRMNLSSFESINNKQTANGICLSLIEVSHKSLEAMKLALPAAAFQHSFGLVVLEAVQVGFIVTAGVGTGIILRHDKVNQQWSPPIAVGLSNVGAVGLERKHMVIFLTEAEMMHTMASDFNFRLGLQSSIVAGSMGQEVDITAQIGTQGAGLTSGYTFTRGLYVGVELEGASLAPRTRVNTAFYGDEITPKKVLFGSIEDMPVCEPLDRLHAKLYELSLTADPDPAYAETIARPFMKNTANTNTVSNQQDE
jgi:lipid-binding SYLF domain-containing protein